MRRSVLQPSWNMQKLWKTRRLVLNKCHVTDVNTPNTHYFDWPFTVFTLLFSHIIMHQWINWIPFIFGIYTNSSLSVSFSFPPVRDGKDYKTKTKRTGLLTVYQLFRWLIHILYNEQKTTQQLLFIFLQISSLNATTMNSPYTFY